MSAKLDKIRTERDKAKQKRDEWDARYKDLDRKYKTQENIEIHDVVHAANLTPDALAVLLSKLKCTGMPDPEEIDEENRTEQKEEDIENEDQDQ